MSSLGYFTSGYDYVAPDLSVSFIYRFHEFIYPTLIRYYHFLSSAFSKIFFSKFSSACFIRLFKTFYPHIWDLSPESATLALLWFSLLPNCLAVKGLCFYFLKNYTFLSFFYFSWHTVDFHNPNPWKFCGTNLSVIPASFLNSINSLVLTLYPNF